ncbi:MAG: S49 family peptidase [Planctomycetota bacterium]|jgi:hypothetical protein
MDFDNTQDSGNSDQPQQPPQTPPVVNIPDFSSAVYDPNPKKKKGSGWKVFFGVVLVLSILANGFMLLGVVLVLSILANGFMLLGMVGMGAVLAGSSASSDNGLVEKVLVDGPRANKIAVINLEGVIDGEMSEDQIHYYISRFKQHTNKPVLAFMQSIAASGGYYSAVACDSIMAEPTVITGSIGVIMNHLVIKDLLQEKHSASIRLRSKAESEKTGPACLMRPPMRKSNI